MRERERQGEKEEGNERERVREGEREGKLVFLMFLGNIKEKKM